MKRVKTYVVLPLLVLAGHAALTPATVRLRTAAEDGYKNWQDDRRVEQFTAGLPSPGGKIREDLLAAVKDLRTALKAGGRELTVVLLPTRESMMTLEGVPFENPPASAQNLQGLAGALAKEDIPHVNLLSAVFREMIHEPGTAFRDHVHYSHPFEAKVAADLLKLRPITEPSIFIGDCFAQSVAEAAQKQTPKVSIRSYWKNASTHAMAYELSKVGEEELAGVKQVFWLIPDFAANDEKKLFAKCATGHEQTAKEGIQVLYARVAYSTEVKQTLNVDSTYDDALVVNKFVGEDGSHFLGIIPVMTKKVVDESVRTWSLQTRLRLTMRDWDAAVAENKKLGNIQMIDDVQNFDLPRYYITDWLHAVPKATAAAP